MRTPISIMIISGVALIMLIAIILMIVFLPSKEEAVRPYDDGMLPDVSSQISSAIQLDTMEDYIGYADHIVYGQVIEETPFEQGSSEYRLAIEQELKGTAEENVIHVYYQSRGLVQGGKYLLFLEAYNGGLYPHTVYKVLRNGGLLHMSDEGVVDGNTLFESNLKTQELLDKIASSPAIGQNRQVNDLEAAIIIPDYLELEELARQADLVAIIEPVEIAKKHKYMAFANIKVVDQLQGTIAISPEELVCLPPEVEVGQQYIAFLQVKEGIPIVASKKGSLFAATDQEQWKAAMSVVEK